MTLGLNKGNKGSMPPNHIDQLQNGLRYVQCKAENYAAKQRSTHKQTYDNIGRGAA